MWGSRLGDWSRNLSILESSVSIWIYLISISNFVDLFPLIPPEKVGFVEKQLTLFDDYDGGVAQTVLRFWCSAFRRLKS